jgi:predicted Fe-Mo cluster-binding NifX family protein
MKIAFPLLNERELAQDFAHSHYIGIYDDTNQKTELIPVKGIKQDVGITLFFDSLSSQGLKFVASPFFSYMTLRVFKENQIETLKAVGNRFDENIKHYKNNALEPFDVYESLHMRDCVKDCSGCDSSCS